MFSLANNNSSYSLRSNNTLILNPMSTNLIATEKSLRYILPIKINEMTNDFLTLISFDNLSTFKINSKNLFLSKYSAEICQQVNCYSCSRRLFYPFFFTRYFSLHTPTIVCFMIKSLYKLHLSNLLYFI